MISCKEAVSRLYAFLDRNLGRVPEAEMEAHLKLCRHCCGELEFAKQVRAALRPIHDDAEQHRFRRWGWRWRRWRCATLGASRIEQVLRHDHVEGCELFFDDG